MSKSNRELDEFEHESLQDPESIVAYLEALSAGIRSGRVLFCWGTQELILRPAGLLQLQVKARRKERRVKVSLDISWKERAADAPTLEPLLIKVEPEEVE